MEETKTENSYLTIAEAELDKELVWIEEDYERIAKIVRADKNKFIRLVCDEIQTDERISKLFQEDVQRIIREYVGTIYEVY